MGIHDIQVMAFRYYYYLRDRRTLQNPVHISVVSVTDPSQPPDVVLLPSVILDYEDVFENDATKMRARVVEAAHTIELRPGSVLPFQPLRNLLATKLEALREYLLTAEKNGWIRRSVSEAGAPILFA
jgi:hypothetical protein